MLAIAGVEVDVSSADDWCPARHVLQHFRRKEITRRSVMCSERIHQHGRLRVKLVQAHSLHDSKVRNAAIARRSPANLGLGISAAGNPQPITQILELRESLQQHSDPSEL